MATTSNKLIPLLGVVLLAIVGAILWQQFSTPARPKAGAPLAEVPSALPKARSAADADTADESLRQVTASNKLLRERIERVIKDNDELREQNVRLGRNRPQQANDNRGVAAPSAPTQSTADVFSGALDTATKAARGLIDNSPFDGPKEGTERGNNGNNGNGGNNGHSSDGTSSAAVATDDAPDGTVRYKLMPPMGYAVQTVKAGASSGGAGSNGGVAMTRFVRTTQVEADYGGYGGNGSPGPASRAAQQAAAAPAKPQSIPYFTIPENATLAGVTSMSSLIGRVPIDGRVTDPMQFKAIVGRDNLAANGFELPDDLVGMIITGVAIGDMALSCSEGKVRSLTFVFNDGSIRTVSARRGRGQGSNNSGSTVTATGSDLGYISDEHGNPCIPGKFVTNAASYLTDIVGAKTLGVAAKAYSEAERTVSTNGYGGFTSAVTGNQNRFALGAAASGATDELTSWLLSRLKNSFDAVVTPSGQKLVVHLDQEIQLDKAADARKLVYRMQDGQQLARGARHGLD